MADTTTMDPVIDRHAQPACRRLDLLRAHDRNRRLAWVAGMTPFLTARVDATRRSIPKEQTATLMRRLDPLTFLLNRFRLGGLGMESAEGLRGARYGGDHNEAKNPWGDFAAGAVRRRLTAGNVKA